MNTEFPSGEDLEARTAKAILMLSMTGEKFLAEQLHGWLVKWRSERISAGFLVCALENSLAAAAEKAAEFNEKATKNATVYAAVTKRANEIAAEAASFADTTKAAAALKTATKA